MNTKAAPTTAHGRLSHKPQRNNDIEQQQHDVRQLSISEQIYYRTAAWKSIKPVA